MQKFLSQRMWIVLALFIIAMAFMADSCSNQTNASIDNATAAQNKWGNTPNITNFYEYKQLKDIYEARDNPKLVLNAYMQSYDGSLRCLGQVLGYGIPYGTQWSQPTGSGGGSVPEPNALYPSTNTAADWIQLIDPTTGKAELTFAEPNLLITPLTLPCKALNQ